MDNEQSVKVERDVDKSNMMAGGLGNQQNISHHYYGYGAAVAAIVISIFTWFVMEEVKVEVDAITVLQQRAESGDIGAANELAHKHKTGEDGVPIDYEKAFKYYEFGAEKGNAEAQSELGLMFEKGQAVEADNKQAVKWYKKASAQGYPTAKFRLGRMYHEGKGVEQNIPKAIELWEVASRDEFIRSQALDLIEKAQEELKTVYKPKKSTFSCKNITEIPQAECEELVHFYHSTGGDNWVNNNGWLKTNEPCGWYRVKCENNSVTRITLLSNGLVGKIPDFFALTQLKVLLLANNYLTGTVPSFIALTQLTHLLLHNNQLTGAIPVFFTTQLVQLNLSNNQLSGVIPDFSTTQIFNLHISNNYLCRNPNIDYGKWKKQISEYPLCE